MSKYSKIIVGGCSWTEKDYPKFAKPKPLDFKMWGELIGEKLNCEVIENNISTQKLHKKFLFKEEGIKKEKITKDYKRIGIYLYGLTKTNWNNKKFTLSKFDNFFNKYNVKFKFDENFLN